jgi:hypothetical protein
MTTFKTLQTSLKKTPIETLALLLGYHNRSHARKARKAFVQADSLYDWLKSGLYDLAHTTVSFFEKACEAFDLDMQECRKELETAQARIEKLRGMKNPWIYVHTGFKHKNEPVFTLAIMEKKRRILLSKERFADLSLEEALEEVSHTVREHYIQKDAQLPVWGKIEQYTYHHLDGCHFPFNPDGSVCKTCKLPEQPPARLTVNGKPFTAAILL